MSRTPLLLSALALAVLSGCSDAPTDPPPAPEPASVTLTPLPDSAVADTTLHLQARVRDASGSGLADIRVEWEVSGGRVDPAAGRTGRDGWAEALWRLPGDTGPHTVTTRAGALETQQTTRVYEARALALFYAPNPSGFVLQPGDSVTLDVLALDGDSVAFGGVPVTWETATAGSSILDADSVTGVSGHAVARWRVLEPGEHIAIVRTDSLSVTFTADVAEPVRLAAFVPHFDTLITEQVDRTVVLDVEARDQFGQGLADVPVQAAVDVGQLESDTVSSDGGGWITLRWTLPPDPVDARIEVHHGDSLIAHATMRARVRYLDLEAGRMPSDLPFTVAPVPWQVLQMIVPPGNMSQPAHTLPTDHTYLFYDPAYYGDPAYPVRAPASGSVLGDPWAGGGDDQALRVGVRAGFAYELGHILLDPAIGEGELIEAGQVVGYHSGLTTSVDFGVLHAEAVQPFLNADRYRRGSLHADAPWNWFTPDLRDTLLSHIAGDDPYGRIAYDQAGTAWGSWWREDTPPDVGGPTGETYAAAFVTDVFDSARPVISLGGLNGLYGGFDGQRSPVPFEEITPTAGPVAILLWPLYSMGEVHPTGPAEGYLLVEHLGSGRMRMEVFGDTTAAPAAFTDASAVYVR